VDGLGDEGQPAGGRSIPHDLRCDVHDAVTQSLAIEGGSVVRLVGVQQVTLAAGRLLEPVLRAPRRVRAVTITLAGLLALAMIPVLLP
jgi:hypothetical protein